MHVHASAPGKLALSGEYAVLEGAPALVLAVEARARVTLEDASDGVCRIAAPDAGVADAQLDLDADGRVQWNDLDAAQRERLDLMTRIIETFGAMQTPFHATLDTHEFADHGEKLGLGSSAALTVALASALCVRAEREPPRIEELIALHRDWQDGRGSGLDVAASLHGGLSIYRLREGKPSIEHVEWPRSLYWCCVWSGRAARTATQLQRLSGWRARAPADHAAAMRDLCGIAEAVAAAVRGGDAYRAFHAFGNYARRLREFGEKADLEIFGDAHRELAALAETCGPVYKPCGAGGGDIGVAFAADKTRIDEFRRRLARTRFREVELKPAGRGLQTGRGKPGSVRSGLIPEQAVI